MISLLYICFKLDKRLKHADLKIRKRRYKNTHPERGELVNAEEIKKLETYLKKLFNSEAIELRRAPKVQDMVELHKGDEFLGTVYRDAEDGDVSYQVNFAVLDIDLD
jgi:hypothetical protein